MYNDKIYFTHKGEKYVEIDWKIYKVLTKKEFVERAVKDLNDKKKKTGEQTLMSDNKIKRLKLKCIEYSGSMYDYRVREDENGNTTVVVLGTEKNALCKLFTIDSKYNLETLIQELTEIRNNI